MRCRGAGGQCHYFHAGCLGQWVTACRSNGGEPSCPRCRGAVEVHQGRLQEFLEADSVLRTATPEAREDIQGLLARLRNVPSEAVGADGASLASTSVSAKCASPSR